MRSSMDAKAQSIFQKPNNFIDLSSSPTLASVTTATPNHKPIGDSDVIDLVNADEVFEVRGFEPVARKRIRLGDGEDSDVEVKTFKTKPVTSALQILEVFPDADAANVETLLKQYKGNAATVLSYMAENEYKKSDTKPAAPHTDTVVHMDSEGHEWSVDFMSANAFQPQSDYIRESADQLQADFPFLSCAGARQGLARYHHHYAIAHDKIFNAVKGIGDDEVQYDRVLTALHSKSKVSVDLKDRLKKCIVGATEPTLKRARSSYKAVITDKTLREEIRFVKLRFREWMEAKRTLRERASAQKLAQQQGTAVECGCCFDSFPIEDMVTCSNEGHLFCISCLRMCSENMIFGQGNLGFDKKTKQPILELLCFHGDGCSSSFPRVYLEKALPPKTLKKYDELQFKLTIERAGLSNNLCSCPKCGFQCDVPKSQRVLHCPVDKCGYDSCRECGEAAHIPLRCNEVEKETQTKGRLKVEEAITAAYIRKCPKCGKGIIKSDGCNKVKCACGQFICYVCRAAIKDYSHFCQKPHCTHSSCNGCSLYSKAEEDDARAMRQAGYKAAEQVQHEYSTCLKDKRKSVDVHVDVESILKGTSSKTS